MASTLKPFRQYNEHEVLNLFSLLPTSTDSHGANCVSMIADGGEHTWDAGRLLMVNDTAANAMKNSTAGAVTDWDPVTLNDDTSGNSYQDAIKGYLGANYNAGSSYKSASGASHVGLFGNSNATLTATPGLVVAAGAAAGISLRSTLAYDENNEKLLYYTNKRDELQCVLPGDAVPCLRRGLIAMIVEGVSSGANLGDPVYGHVDSTVEGGLITTDGTDNGLAIGEVVVVMDVRAADSICLVQIDI
jgi:hypothetical protein